MTVRSLLTLAATVGLGLASSTYADQPASKKAAIANQKLADDVAARIGNSGTANGASVSVKVASGVVELTGEVLSVRQTQLIVQQALAVPGVVEVKTYMALAAGGDIQPVQASEPMTIVPPMSSGPGLGGAGPQEPIPLAQGRHAELRPDRPENAALFVADICPVQQLLARRVPAGLPLHGLPVHRALLSLPEGAAGLAFGEVGVERRTLVPRPAVNAARLLASPVLVIPAM